MAATFRTTCAASVYTALTTAGQAIKLRNVSRGGRLVIATSLPAPNVTNFITVRMNDELFNTTLFVGASDIVYFMPAADSGSPATGDIEGVAGAAADFGSGGGASTPQLAAGENHIGSVGGNTSYIDVTLTLDTSIYVANDVLSDTAAIANAMRVNDGTGVLESIQLLDIDHQGQAIDLVFMSANRVLGTKNAVVSISDADAADILGHVQISTGDYIDLVASHSACKVGIGMVIKPVSGGKTVYVGAILRSGTPTYTAAGIKLRLGFFQD